MGAPIVGLYVRYLALGHAAPDMVRSQAES